MADIVALSNLLNEDQVNDDDTQDRAAGKGGGSSLVTPASIGPAGGTQKKESSMTNAAVPSKKTNQEAKALWDEAEVPEEGDIDDMEDTRPPPRYEIYYKQQVGTEDVFLGTGDKTPSSNDCTHVVVKIHFPGCKLADLELDVTKTKIKAESSTLKLSTYLPLPVHHEKGHAKFDAKKSMLIITLPILLDDL